MERAFRITLTAHYPDGRPVAPEDFIEPLAIDPKDREREHILEAFPGGGRWQAARVTFINTDATRYDVEEKIDYATIYLPVQEYVAEWLRERSNALFDGFRQRGLDIAFVVTLAIDQNQMEFRLAPAFLRACGEKGLEIVLETYDVAGADPAYTKRGGELIPTGPGYSTYTPIRG